MESSDDPLFLQANGNKSTYRRPPSLEKRASNPFDISAGDNRPLEEESSELSELSNLSSDPTLLKGRDQPPVDAEERITRHGKVFVQSRHIELREQGKKDAQVHWVVLGDAEDLEGDERTEEDHAFEQPESHKDGNVPFLPGEEEGVDQQDITLPYVVEDEMMVIDGDTFYEGPIAEEGPMEQALEYDADLEGDQEVQEVDGVPMGDPELQWVFSEGDFVPHTSDDEIAKELKNPEEQVEIEEEIEDLLQKMPGLREDYELIDRLGTGTFSSVYKATDRRYSEWDNRLWQVEHPQSTSMLYPFTRSGRDKAPEDSILSKAKRPAYVAIKRIMVTSSPKRIVNEILIMESCRGCRNVAQIITVYRVEDQIVIVMPYQRSTDLRDLVKDLTPKGIRQYFRCMFRALRDIHARGIIHRDLKPGNFLFDPLTWTGTMVDFGLAETFDIGEEKEKDSGCLHTGPLENAPHGMLKEGQMWTRLMRKSLKASKEKSEMPPENVGWPTDDPRPQVKANRAGTRGFRAPEVLFKCTVQTPAVDIWSAGIILLFFLTKKWPIFQATSDMHALLEQALILGKDVMEQCAALHGRTFSTNIPEVQQRLPWTHFVMKLNPLLFESLNRPPSSPNLSQDSNEGDRSLLEAALDLLGKCLEPISVRRCTAREALYHPFLAPDEEEVSQARVLAGVEKGASFNPLDEDECFPHPPGEGVCAKYHEQDLDTGDWKVFIGLTEDGEYDWQTIEAGEGQAIGSKPCEFHRDFKD